MLGREPAGGALVDADRRDVELLGAAVHEDEPRALLEQLRVVRVLPRRSVTSLEMKIIPVDAALEEHLHVVGLAQRRAAVLQRIVARPASAARSSIASASAAKIGLPNSGTSSPIAPVGSARPGGT